MKSKVGAGRRKRAAGKGFFSSIGNAFRSAGNWVKDNAPGIAKVVKDNNLASRALGLAGAAGVPGAAVASQGVKLAGYGRRRQGGRGKLLNEQTKVILM